MASEYNAQPIKAPTLFTMVGGAAEQSFMSKLAGQQGADHLEPQAASGLGIVDVPADFQWTASMRTEYIKQEVPRLTLREYNVVGNAVQQQAMYMMSFGLNAMGGAAAGAALGGLIGGAPGAAVGGVIGGAAGNAALGTKGYLEAYKGLYDVKRTGFIYDLPFIEENFRTISTQWAAATVSNSKILGNRISGLRGGLQSLGTDLATVLDEPNAFVEEPQQYTHNQMGDPFQFRFFLSNTGTYDDVVRNWHLAYLLMFQNLPNRTSRVLVKPPVIYEVDLPGVMYHPFCYMNQVNVNYKGAQRRMGITVQNQQGKEAVSVEGRAPGDTQRRHAKADKGMLNTTIPDAYEIVITMTPLVKETQNFMQQMASKNSTIFEAKVRK